MYILRVTRLLIIVTLMTFLTLMVTGSVSPHLVESLAAAGVPFLLLTSGLTNHYEDKRKGQELDRLTSKPPWYADKQELGFREKAHELEAKLQDSENQRRALLLTLEEKAFLRKYPVGKGTPAEQLGQISREYGLPVTTKPGTHKRALPRAVGASVTASKGRAYWHRCGSGFFEEVRFCPKHGYPGDVSGDTSPEQHLDNARRNIDDVRLRLASAGFTSESEVPAQPEPEYVPEGYGQMLATLLLNMSAWTDDAQEHGGEYEWHMSDAWAKDVQAIPDQLDPEKHKSVISQFQPGVLFGYHVVTGAQFGAPELVVR